MTISILNTAFEAAAKAVGITQIEKVATDTFNLYCNIDRFFAYTNAVVFGTYAGMYKIESVTTDYVQIKNITGAESMEIGDVLSLYESTNTVKPVLNILFETFQNAKGLNIRNHYSQINQTAKFPLLLCITDISESETDNIFTPDLNLYLIIGTERNATNLERNESTMKYLRVLEKDLKRALETTDGILDVEFSQRTELFYDGEPNKLEKRIDAIYIKPDLKLLKHKCYGL